jgi:hypothetical protein
MVYIARKDGGVVHHTSLEAMSAIDGIDAPEMTVSEAEFEAAGGLARITNGKIVLGKTKEEKAREQAECRTLEIDAELRGLDAKSARPARAVARAIAGGVPPNPADVARLDEYETRADALRSEKSGLLTGAAG